MAQNSQNRNLCNQDQTLQNRVFRDHVSNVHVINDNYSMLSMTTTLYGEDVSVNAGIPVYQTQQMWQTEPVTEMHIIVKIAMDSMSVDRHNKSMSKGNKR